MHLCVPLLPGTLTSSQLCIKLDFLLPHLTVLNSFGMYIIDVLGVYSLVLYKNLQLNTRSFLLHCLKYGKDTDEIVCQCSREFIELKHCRNFNSTRIPVTV